MVNTSTMLLIHTLFHQGKQFVRKFCVQNSVMTVASSTQQYIDNDVTPWYIYNKDDDKWCYRNEDNTVREWYEYGGEPDGYVKYINYVGTVRNTADAGESLVMCWTSGTSSTFDFIN